MCNFVMIKLLISFISISLSVTIAIGADDTPPPVQVQYFNAAGSPSTPTPAATVSLSNSSPTPNNNDADVDDNYLDHEMSMSNKYNNSLQPLDRFFSVDKIIFEKHWKAVDVNIIPGLQDDDDFENWIPSMEIQKDLPTYMSGFDMNNRPVWIMEMGKWDFAKYATGALKTQELARKYVRYLAYLSLKSAALRSTDEHPVNQHVTILDLERLQRDLLINPRILSFIVRTVNDYRGFSEKHLAKTVMLNVSQLSDVLLSLSRFFSPGLASRFEVYGTNKAVWARQLLKSFPKDQIPEWYGGSKGFKPLYVIG